MIAYYFPPLGGSGALRPVKLAKFLPEFEWEPIILTAKHSDWYYAYDPGLKGDLPPSARIYRSTMLPSAWIYRMLNPTRNSSLEKLMGDFLIQPDNMVGWMPFAYQKAMTIIRRIGVDAIYSTSAPISCHLIALRLHRKTGLPWVADFRDEWFDNPHFNFPTSFHRSLHYQLENKVVKNAEAVIAPAPFFCDLLSKHQRNSDKYHTIYMGYDPDEMSAAAGSSIQKKHDLFLTLHAGLFYGTFRPDRVLEAVEDLIKEGSIPAEEIRVCFVGANRRSDTGFKNAYPKCEFSGFVSHREAIAQMNAADMLLLLLSKTRGENVIPSKTFEYIASGKPILAVVPETGAVAEIIRQTGSGLVVDFEDYNGIKSAYVKMYRAWKSGQPFLRPDRDEIRKFDQRVITGKFAEILHKVTHGEPGVRRSG